MKWLHFWNKGITKHAADYFQEFSQYVIINLNFFFLIKFRKCVYKSLIWSESWKKTNLLKNIWTPLQAFIANLKGFMSEYKLQLVNIRTGIGWCEVDQRSKYPKLNYKDEGILRITRVNLQFSRSICTVDLESSLFSLWIKKRGNVAQIELMNSISSHKL